MKYNTFNLNFVLPQVPVLFEVKQLCQQLSAIEDFRHLKGQRYSLSLLLCLLLLAKLAGQDSLVAVAYWLGSLREELEW